MHKASVWLIRTSLVYFVIGITLGMLMLLQKAFPIKAGIWQVLPVHAELLLFGWVLQLVLGVGYWMLPRQIEGPERGWPAGIWWIYGMFNGGILINLLAIAMGRAGMEGTPVGRLMQLAAILLFIALHWRRVVSYRS